MFKPAHRFGLAKGAQFPTKDMKILKEKIRQAGGGSGYLLLWLIGVPVPVLVLIFLLRGCH